MLTAYLVASLVLAPAAMPVLSPPAPRLSAVPAPVIVPTLLARAGKAAEDAGGTDKSPWAVLPCSNTKRRMVC